MSKKTLGRRKHGGLGDKPRWQSVLPVEAERRERSFLEIEGGPIKDGMWKGEEVLPQASLLEHLLSARGQSLATELAGEVSLAFHERDRYGTTGQQIGEQCPRGTATDDDRVAPHSRMISRPLTKSCSSTAWPVHEVRAEPNMKVEVGRRLLREATADMRDAFREPVSLDTRPTVEREWLAMQVSKLATEILSPDTLKDLEAFESAQNAKRALREQGGDAKDHAMKLVDYLEALAEDLTEDDLDEDIDLPGSFRQFRKAHGG